MSDETILAEKKRAGESLKEIGVSLPFALSFISLSFLPSQAPSPSAAEYRRYLASLTPSRERPREGRRLELLLRVLN